MAPGRRKVGETSSKNKTEENGEGVEARSSKRNESNNSVPLKDIPINVVKQFELLQRNGIKGSYIHRSGECVITQRLKHFSVFKIVNEFECRVTCVSWHPFKKFFIAGSKGGAMIMMNYSNDTFVEKKQWPGGGPGLSILSIHYLDHMAQNHFLTACIDGTVKLWDIERDADEPVKVLMSTGTLQRWFCSVNSCPERDAILVGDTKGNLITIDKNYRVVSTDKIHKSKVNTIEFSRKGGFTFATASVDKTVKIFDLRNLSRPVDVFKHNSSVNSAYFSRTSSGRLLTTDQDCELRIYKGPVWELERTVRHPHRQFMHMTQIKASWHPLADLIVVGRYPDPSKADLKHMKLKTVDIFSADTGMLTNELYSANCGGILSLNEFNPSGEFLASGMGLYIPIWRLSYPCLKHKLPSDENRSGSGDNDDNDSGGGPPKKKKPRKQTDSKHTKKCQ